jgi:NAD(P)-dependent dehydrogenase (short-subunit alcohol dehydrogenase family)
VSFVAVVEQVGSPLGAHVVTRLEQLGARVDAFTSWEEHGAVDAYVHLGPWSEPPPRTPLVELDDASFTAWFERPFAALLWSLHEAYAHLRRPGARVVVVVPTISMAGAPGLAATAAAAEAQRVMVKSAARQWGAEGIVMNVVAADLTALAPGEVDLPSVSLSPPALGAARVADLDAVARVVADLAADGATAVTGVTVSADGGTWMAP